MRVLIVDDDPDFCECLAHWFRADGVFAQICSNGKEALWMLAEEQFDAVLLDRNMPGFWGDEVLIQIRSDACFDGVCVVFLSGYVDITSTANLIRRGAFHCLQKPTAPQSILEVIRTGVTWQRMQIGRFQLLASAELPDLLRCVGEVFRDILPLNGMYLLCVAADGTICEAVGMPDVPLDVKLLGTRVSAANRALESGRIGFLRKSDGAAPPQALVVGTQTLAMIPVSRRPRPLVVLQVEWMESCAIDTLWEVALDRLAENIRLWLDLPDTANVEVHPCSVRRHYQKWNAS